MKQLKLRVATAENAKDITDWLRLNGLNRYDEGILSYPTLRVVCSYEPDSKKPICYLPSQKVLMLESLATNPESNALERAQALRDLVKASELMASSDGIREIYFLAGDGGVGEMAERHGFEELTLKVYRMKL